MVQDRFHSPTRSAASTSPTGNQMSDVTTRVDDRWARLTLMLWSQHEEDWRERVKSGKMESTIEPPTCSHPTSARQKGANQFVRWEKLHEMSATTLDGKARLLEGGEGSTRESLRRRKWPEGWRNRRTEPFDPLQDGLCHEPEFPTLEQMNDELRNDQPNHERVSIWTDITNSHGSREQQHQQPPRGSAQGTGTTSRVFLQHMWVQAITDAASSTTAGVCSDGSHSTARGKHNKQQRRGTSEETRRKTSRG